MNKKGFELSANMMVVIILSLVLFGSGMVIFSKVIGGGKEIETGLTEQMREKLDAAMDDGSLIVIPQTTMHVQQGNTAKFTVGFWNELDEEIEFKLNVEGVEGPWPGQISYANTYPLKHNERAHALIAINVPKGISRGQYAFNVEIENSPGQLYTNKMNRIYVVVS
ncbi:MAG: hypothetical protein ABH828_00095 [archaeon]